MYHARTIAIVCILFAASYLELPAIKDDKYYRVENWLTLKKTPLKLPLEDESFYTDLTDTQYLALPWYQRIHPALTIIEIEGIS